MIYGWKRFWCPRDGAINLSDMGFLSDPEGERGRILNPYVVPYTSIAGIPCLVLLGEPGMGKSTAMATEQAGICSSVAELGGVSLWFDLRAYQTEDRLCQKIFASKPFRKWRK